VSHKTKTILGTATLIAAAISAPGFAQTVPVINDVPVSQQAAPEIQIYEPLRPQSNSTLPSAPEMEVTPLPEGTVPTTLPAPLESAPLQTMSGPRPLW